MAVHLTSSGLSMPASQSASGDANTMDDYEEGTFTPAVSSGTGGQTGYYMKVGNLVTASFHCDDIGAATNNTTFTITGLPFTARSSGYSGGGHTTMTHYLEKSSPSAGLQTMILITANSSTISPSWNNSNSTLQQPMKNVDFDHSQSGCHGKVAYYV